MHMLLKRLLLGSSVSSFIVVPRKFLDDEESDDTELCHVKYFTSFVAETAIQILEVRSFMITKRTQDIKSFIITKAFFYSRFPPTKTHTNTNVDRNLMDNMSTTIKCPKSQSELELI